MDVCDVIILNCCIVELQHVCQTVAVLLYEVLSKLQFDALALLANRTLHWSGCLQLNCIL